MIAGSVCTIFFSVFSANDVCAEEVLNSWDETQRVHKLRREIPTAINVYTDYMVPGEVKHEEGMIDEIMYDILRVTPSEHTFLQVDYSEVPLHLNELKDYQTIQSGYYYAGGVNGGYFSNTSYEYGRPVGAVRRHNAWTYWYGMENAPAYGTGYATAYFNGENMWLRYHGWASNDWYGDDTWKWWTGYKIDAEYGISGSFTYFVEGEEADITGGSSGSFDYRRYGRAVTIFAQNRRKEYLLITIYGTLKEERIRQMLRELDVYNAIRMDGGGSCQMVYETDIVEEVRPELEWTEIPEDIAAETEEAIGMADILVPSMDVYSFPDWESGTRGDIYSGSKYQVYEISKSEDGTVWYRIGTMRWIPAAEDSVLYQEIKYVIPIRISIKEPVQIYSKPELSLEFEGTADPGDIYTVYETVPEGDVIWHRIGKNEWIPVEDGTVEIITDASKLHKLQTDFTPQMPSQSGMLMPVMDGGIKKS